MITKKGSFNFKQTRAKYNEFKRRIPNLVANASRNHFVDGFRKGGGQTDRSRSGWKPRRPARSERQARRDSGRALLVLSGNMRSDLRVRGVSFRKSVVNIINIPYAKYHNEGSGKIPQREMVGRSKPLERQNRILIERELKKVS